MTNTQIAYWELEEKRRHNLATEGLQTLGHQETVRHNIATESYALKDLGERSRHNVVVEGQGAQQLVITRLKLDEDIRHNTATEKEASRSNRAREIENERSNRARELETRRHNLADEILSGERNTIESRKAAEVARHNVVSEQIDAQRADNALTKYGLIAQLVRSVTGDVTGNLAALIAGLHPRTAIQTIQEKVEESNREVQKRRENEEREASNARNEFKESGKGPTQYTKEQMWRMAEQIQQREQAMKPGVKDTIRQQKTDLQRKRAG